MDSETLQIYKDLHQIPEIGLEEYETSKYIREKLKAIQELTFIETMKNPTAVIAVLEPEKQASKHPYLFRCDIDALPMKEESGVPYASTNGLHHACGHDGHTAMMIVAIKNIVKRRQELQRKIIFCFQPGEEGKGGANKLFSELPHLLDHVEHCFAIHLTNLASRGKLLIHQKEVTSNTNRISIEIHGKGGHVFLSDECIDANYIGCNLVTHLYSLKSRILPSNSHGVLVVTSVEGGKKMSSVSGFFKINISVRTLSLQHHQKMLNQIQNFSVKFVESFGAKCSVDISESNYRSVVNDRKAVQVVHESIKDCLGQHSVQLINQPSSAGEDFCEFSQRIPSCYFLLGVEYTPKDKTEKGNYFFHSSTFRIDQQALNYGPKVWQQIAFH